MWEWEDDILWLLGGRLEWDDGGEDEEPVLDELLVEEACGLGNDTLVLVDDALLGDILELGDGIGDDVEVLGDGIGEDVEVLGDDTLALEDGNLAVDDTLEDDILAVVGDIVVLVYGILVLQDDIQVWEDGTQVLEDGMQVLVLDVYIWELE